jgi:hypothetical protein
MKTGKFSVLVLFFAAVALQAQTPGTWKSHVAYNEATLVTETPNAVYAVYDGSLLSYSPDDQSVQTYSVQDDLSASSIRHLHYCPDSKTLLIVYDDSNIDLFQGRNNVRHLPDIKNNTYLTNKTVNSVDIRNGNAYLSTGFGIVVIDLLKQEIKNTYRFDVNTTASCEWDDYLYAATDNGLIRALLSSNLTDRDNWTPVDGLDAIHIDKMLLFNDHLVFYDGLHLSLWCFSRQGILKRFDNGNICRQLSVFNNRLVAIYYHVIAFYTDFDIVTGIVLDENIRAISSVYSGSDYWIAWGDRGILKIATHQLPDGWSEYETLLSDIRPNSPKRNLSFRLKFSGEKLFVTGGDRSGERLNRPGTFMIYENGQWKSLDEQAVSEQTGLICQDFTDAVEDPRSPGRYYVSSWGEGIYVFNQDLELETRYSFHNSTLQPATTNVDYYPNFVRVDGMIFDSHNNLYTTNAGVTNGLHILSADGHWSAHRYDHLAGIQPNRILIARDGKKWINFFRRGSSAGAGIFVLDDTQGDPNDSSDDARDLVYHSEQFTDQQGRNVGANNYLCMVEDLSGTIWVGTDNGPITFSSAEQVDRGECYRPVGTDEYGEGYYLLEGQRVNAIAIDGGNRKWIGTDGSGLFLVDQADGQLNVRNFTTDNSLLLSNNINSLAINGRTGEVFIGTSRGICSYQGDAIDGLPDYTSVRAFPNPVFPNRNNTVVITGLMQNSRVKITDIAGNLIKESVSNGGQYTWNCANAGGQRVSSGIYLVFAVLPDGTQGVVTKIMILK